MGVHRRTHPRSTRRRRHAASRAAVIATAAALVLSAATAVEAPAASAGEIGIPTTDTVAVNTTADTVASDGATSLREAITIVDQDPGLHTVLLGAGQTYVLDRCQGGVDENANVGGDLDHTAAQTVTIVGNGSTVRQTCTNERVLHKTSATGNLRLEDVTIADGVGVTAGGGVRGAGDVLLDGVTVRDNVAISGGGGGVYAAGEIAADDSTFVDNAGSSNGAGLRAVDTIWLFTSTVARNVAGGHGGGLYTPGVAQIRNSTVTQNRSVYGGGVEADSVQLVNATVVANTASHGANVAGPELNPISSIIALGRGGTDCDVDSTVFSSSNLGDDGSCVLQSGTDLQGVHPMVGPLTSWGGPTQTRRPVAPSEAIDHDAPPCQVSHDQRGQARPFGAGCDAGAFEGAAQPCNVVFPDVSGGHQFFEEICWLSQMGITGGFGDGTFQPGQAVSRQAMAAFLHRLAGAPLLYPPEVAEFSDVAVDHPFAREISWAVEEEVADGYPDGTFRPTTPVSRQAMAAFLHRIAGSPPVAVPGTPTFSDVQPGHPFFSQIEWLAAQGITTGYPDGTFQPGTSVSRQAMAAFLLRMAEDVPLAGI